MTGFIRTEYRYRPPTQDVPTFSYAEKWWLDLIYDQPRAAQAKQLLYAKTDLAQNTAILAGPITPPFTALTPETWHQGSFFLGQKMCLGYALFGSDTWVNRYRLNPYQEKIAQLLIDIIVEHFPERITQFDFKKVRDESPITTIASFNDHTQTTFDDVQKVYTELQRRMEFL